MRDPSGGGWLENRLEGVLSPREAYAAGSVIRRVRRFVPAELAQALLFGSKSRRTARPDSDVDLLLIFRSLPPDREPQATIAEEIADEVAAQSGVPVATWSVALVDLQRGMRTPMLVDALTDGVPLWPIGVPSPRLPFTPEDALRCAAALLERVGEGSEEVAWKRSVGDLQGAWRRGRDDVVRMCTAALLLHGETRPRRAHAVERFLDTYVESGGFQGGCRAVLEWAVESFGPTGKDEDRPVGRPPGGFPGLGAAVDSLRHWVAARREELERQLVEGGNGVAPHAYDRSG